MASVWDICALSGEEELHVESLLSMQPDGESAPSSSSSRPSSSADYPRSPDTSAAGTRSAYVDVLQSSLSSTELSCRSFIEELDKILYALGEVSTEFNDVTGRTNNLMMNCEALLEQQHTLEVTVEKLRKYLEPFDQVEKAARLLGIPIDAKTNQNKLIGGKDGIRDPRSPEFKEVLSCLSNSISFLTDHGEIYDAVKYHHWVVQLQNRATSLVAKAIRVLLDEAALSQKMANEPSSLKTRDGKGTHKNSAAMMLADDQPLESSPIYKKFRGLGFRVRELTALLSLSNGNSDNNSTAAKNTSSADLGVQDVLAEVKRSYIMLRTKLMLPFLKDLSIPEVAKAATPAESKDANAGGQRTMLIINGKDEKILLCSGIRHAYSMLLRVTQLEQQLFESLFMSDPGPEENGSAKSKSSENSKKNGDYNFSPEVLSIIESLCNTISDGLRPLIIRESDVDELCRVTNTLAEDVKSQMVNLNIPSTLQKELLRGLDRTICDTQERLSYCAEMKLRKEVQLFKPLPSHLAYPDILENFNEPPSGTETEVTQLQEDKDVSKTWFPPLQYTLALLSKLYGVVEMGVFEDFARRAVNQCVTSLRLGSEGVSRNRTALHGDLFLIRHLLILREQLLPFDIRLQCSERKLNFQTTGQALSHFAGTARQALGFNRHAFQQGISGMWNLAKEGLPTLQEDQLDAKKELDVILKESCNNLKHSAVRMLLGALDGFLAKVGAFAGEIPIVHDNAEGTELPLLSSEATATLSKQAFMRASRIMDVLNDTQQAVVQNIPDLRSTMKLYVENSVARTILLKPVQQEIEVIRRKMECIIASCVDAGQDRQGLEQLVNSISTTVGSELLQ